MTVVLPVRNEADFIERSLGAVLSQDYPADLVDIVVADGSSDDGTPEIVTRLMKQHPRVRLINNPERIVATGLNRAMAQTLGDVVVRVDGHCEIASDYISRCIDHLRSGADGVGGPIQTIGQTPLAQVIATAMSSKFGVGDSAFRTLTDRSLFADTVPFPAYTRAIIDKAGAYDTELVRNQDDEYNYRLRKMGARLLLAADVRSRYYSRGSLKSLWRQYLPVRLLESARPSEAPVADERPAIYSAGVRRRPDRLGRCGSVHEKRMAALRGRDRALRGRKPDGRSPGDAAPAAVAAVDAAAGVRDASRRIRSRVSAGFAAILEPLGGWKGWISSEGGRRLRVTYLGQACHCSSTSAACGF